MQHSTVCRDHVDAVEGIYVVEIIERRHERVNYSTVADHIYHFLSRDEDFSHFVIDPDMGHRRIESNQVYSIIVSYGVELD